MAEHRHTVRVPAKVDNVGVDPGERADQVAERVVTACLGACCFLTNTANHFW